MGMRRKGDTIDWMVRHIPIMILVLFTLVVIFETATFDVQGAGTDIVLQGHVDKIDGWCQRSVEKRTMEFDLPENVEAVTIREGTDYVATLADGSTVRVPSDACDRVAICAAGGNGRSCTVGGALPGGTFEADLFFDGAQVIIDPPT